MTYSPKTYKKCSFVKMTKERGKIAAEARKKSTSESKAKTEAIKKDKIKRLKEFESWWR